MSDLKSETPQEKGRKFEEAFAKKLGVEPQRGSGNQWTAKMDVADGTILWSLKHTGKSSFRLDRSLMQEAQAAITGQGGMGGSTIPGVAVELEETGEIYVVFQAEDFMRMVTENVKYITPSKGEQKRNRATVPALLRDEEENG